MQIAPTISFTRLLRYSFQRAVGTAGHVALPGIVGETVIWTFDACCFKDLKSGLSCNVAFEI